MLTNILFLFLLLASTEFFTLSFISDDLNKILGVFSLAIALILIVVHRLTYKHNEKNNIDIFSKGVWLIIFSVLLGTLGAFYLHGQSIFISLIVQRFMYFYIIYFFLKEFKINPMLVEKYLLIMGLFFEIIYLFAYFLPSNDIIQAKSIFDESRLTKRIFLPGISFLIAGILYSFSKYFEKSEYKNLIFLILGLVIIIFTGSRIIMIPTFLILFLMFFRSFRKVSVNKYFLVVVIVCAVLIYNWEILDSIYTITFASGLSNVSNLNIRLESITFYLFDFSKGWLSYILGNGVGSQNVDYGLDILYFKKAFGFYQSDIGIFGDISRFGIFYLIGVIFILIKVYKTKLTPRGNYLKYFFLYVAIAMLTMSYFGESSGIATLSCTLYLIEHYNIKTCQAYNKLSPSNG